MKRKHYILLIVVFLSLGGIRIAVHPPPPRLDRTTESIHGLYEYRGLIHLHTTYSDGEGSVEEVAEGANNVGLDFLISTDHNTLQPLLDQKEGWYDNILFLVGEEISMQGGYILGIGITRPVEKGKEKNPQAVVDEVLQQGGLPFIAHPLNYRFKWENWNVTGLKGMEILDLDDQWRKANPLFLLWGFITYPLNPSYGFMNLYHRPKDVLEKWDELTQEHPWVGIYSPDLHDQFPLFKGFYVKFPARENTMPFASNHLLLSKPLTGNVQDDKTEILRALARGNLYIGVDLFGNPKGFIFEATTEKSQRYLMGDRVDETGPMTLQADLGPYNPHPSYRIKLFKNGTIISSSDKKPLFYQTDERGTYRVEVDISISSPFFIPHTYTWIYSNPIYVR